MAKNEYGVELDIFKIIALLLQTFPCQIQRIFNDMTDAGSKIAHDVI